MNLASRYFTVEEIARRLNVKRPAIYRWLQSGKLRAVKAGSGWRISDADLEEFLRPNRAA